MEPDFSGYVTRFGIVCTDGRTIQPGAFKHQDGKKVPLVYQHQHNDVSQVLGYTILSNREDGVWGDSYLNGSAKAADAREAVRHGDLDKYSIWAKDLDERILNNQSLVHDGVIQETSLVLAGANSGASIYNILAHGNMEDDEFMIVGGEIMHDDTSGDKPSEDPAKKTDEPAPQEGAPKADPADQPEEGDTTVADVLATLDETQQTAVNAFIDDVVKEAVTEALTEEPQLTHSDSTKGSNMSRNTFDRSENDGGGTSTATKELKHDDVQAILQVAKGPSGEGGASATGSLRELVRSKQGTELMHADDYGVRNIEVLFPDARALMNTPQFVDRRQDWVKKFLAGTSHSPFSRVKTTYADITADEARARGYIKANQKVDEVFPVFRRTTGPAWIYKRQKLDRQDIIDITDFDVVAWMKVEMRGKLDEELARAGLFGDGRDALLGDGTPNPDKVQEPTGNEGNGIRSVFNDDDLYATRYFVPMPAAPDNDDYNAFLDQITEVQEFYLGSGNKTAFLSYRMATKFLTLRNPMTGQRIYRNLSEVAGDMDVSQIVRVPTELMPAGCLAIILDLADYNFGTDRGGDLTFFDDFDIDFNQYKYLYEVYLSGALTLPYCAQIFMSVDPAEQTLVADITPPTVAANVVTVPTQTGVVYKNANDGSTLVGGSTITLNESNKQVVIEATPNATHYFESDSDMKDNWTFRYKA